MGNEKGPVIAIVDSGGQCLIAIWQVVKGLRDTAETGGISCLMGTGSGRTTDATAIHRNKGRRPDMTISPPPLRPLSGGGSGDRGYQSGS